MISKGQERIQIPDLKGTTPDIASQQLSALGLTVGDINESFDMKVASGFVITSDPKNGAEVKRSSIVNLIVSKGVEQISLVSFRQVKELKFFQLQVVDSHQKSSQRATAEQ